MISNHSYKETFKFFSVTDTIYELLYFTYAYVSNLNKEQ